MAYLEVGCGKPLGEAALSVYFDCLGDLPADVLRLAAKRVVLEHRWATFPSIAELREAAALTQRGEVRGMSPGEAWSLAWHAIANCDPEIELRGGAKDALGKLPPLVAEAVRAMGVLPLCYGQEPVAVIRGQFMRVYGELAARQTRTDLLPAATRTAIAAAPATAQVAGLLNGIGESV